MSLSNFSTYSNSPMPPEPYRLMFDEHGAICRCGCGRNTWREWWDGLRYVPFYSREHMEKGEAAVRPELQHRSFPDEMRKKW